MIAIKKSGKERLEKYERKLKIVLICRQWVQKAEIEGVGEFASKEIRYNAFSDCSLYLQSYIIPQIDWSFAKLKH